MRLTSLIILVLAIAGVAYVGLFKRDWLFHQAENTRKTLSGYTPARTPEEAMQQFTSAIKNRDYKAASVYVTPVYADYLLKSASEANSIGSRVDTLVNLMKDHGLTNDKSLLILMYLDPFPPQFQPQAKLKSTDKKKAVGVFVADTLPQADVSNVQGLDWKMFRNALMPPVPTNTPTFNVTVNIIKDETGDSWKLDIPMNDFSKDEVQHFLHHYKKYENALDTMITYARQSGRFDSPRAFQDELVSVLSKQKGD
jgi:hypothetical protein